MHKTVDKGLSNSTVEICLNYRNEIPMTIPEMLLQYEVPYPVITVTENVSGNAVLQSCEEINSEVL